MKNKVIDLFIDNISKAYNEELASNVKKFAYNYYRFLIDKYYDDPKKLKKQTLNNMFPIISVYKGLLYNNVSKEAAYRLMDEINYQKSIKNGKQTGSLLKLFSLYKLYPRIFKHVTLTSFSKDIGFDPEFVTTNKTECKFNMKKCIFCDRCKELDCFELTPIFCHTDDGFNENLHKYIKWHRTGTLAKGDSCCDFDVYIDKKEQK